MAWTPPTDPVAGTLATAAYMVTNVIDNLRALRTDSLSAFDRAGLGQVRWEAGISPGTLSSNQNNWNPTDLATANVINAQASTGVSLTGLVAQPAGTHLLLRNAGNIGQSTITLNHEDANSTDVNRFYLPGGSNVAIAPAEVAHLFYSSRSRWELLQA